MKCPHCGSPIRLEDKYCSYCGLPNDLAAQHQKDMKHYQKAFDQTRSEVLDSTRKSRKKMGSFLVLAVMVILILFTSQAEEFSWHLGLRLQKLQIKAYKEKHLSALEDMLDNQDALGLGEYYDRYSLYLSDDFRCYNAVNDASAYFEMVFFFISDYLVDPDYVDEENQSRYIRSLANNLNEIFHVKEKYSYDEDLYFNQNRLDYIRSIQDDTKALLVAYLGLTPDEADSYEDLSSSRQYALLERKFALS